MSEFQTKLNSVPSGGFLTDRDKDKKPILDVRELGIDFGGLTAVDGFKPDDRPHRDHRSDRPQRCRQDHGVQPADQCLPAYPRLHPDRWNAYGGQKRPIRSTGWASPVPSRTSVCSRR